VGRKVVAGVLVIAIALAVYVAEQHRNHASRNRNVASYCQALQAVADAANQGDQEMYTIWRSTLNDDAVRIGGQMLSDTEAVDLAATPEQAVPYLSRLRDDCAIAGHPTS
jgi:hypothetical protein